MSSKAVSCDMTLAQQITPSHGDWRPFGQPLLTTVLTDYCWFCKIPNSLLKLTEMHYTSSLDFYFHLGSRD